MPEGVSIIGAGNCRLGCGCGWASGCLLGVHERWRGVGRLGEPPILRYAGWVHASRHSQDGAPDYERSPGT